MLHHTKQVLSFPAASLQRPDKCFLTLSLTQTADEVYSHQGLGKHWPSLAYVAILIPDSVKISLIAWQLAEIFIYSSSLRTDCLCCVTKINSLS